MPGATDALQESMSAWCLTGCFICCTAVFWFLGLIIELSFSSPTIGIFSTVRTMSLTLYLTIICQFGAYMWCPLLILLYPSQRPSVPLLSSFPALVFIMKTLVPQSGRSAKFSLALCIVSYGVLPFSAHVDVLFFSHTVWWIVSGHIFLGSCAVNSIALACSKSIWFNFSVTPFSLGMLCTVKLLIVPWAFRWVLSSLERYSPPQLDWRILMCLPYWVLMQASYSLYFDNTSIFDLYSILSYTLYSHQWNSHNRVYHYSLVGLQGPTCLSVSCLLVPGRHTWLILFWLAYEWAWLWRMWGRSLLQIWDLTWVPEWLSVQLLVW